MKKEFYEYESVSLGYSEIASLVFRGMTRFADRSCVQLAKIVNFGKDKTYSAYLVDENADIGKHYNLLETFNYWLRIYDDDGLVLHVNAPIIRVYQAEESWNKYGDCEIIIQTQGVLN